MAQSSRRWQTTFGHWVSAYGVSRLAHALTARGEPATPKAIYNWVAGTCQPRASRALAIVEISAGAVSLSDVCAHRVQAENSHASAPRAPG